MLVLKPEKSYAWALFVFAPLFLSALFFDSGFEPVDTGVSATVQADVNAGGSGGTTKSFGPIYSSGEKDPRA